MTLRIIAVREFSERVRSRLFLGVNAFLVVAIVAAIALPQVLGGEPDALRLGAADPTSGAIAEAAAARVDEPGFEVTEVADREAGIAAIEEGTLDALIVDGEALVVERSIPMWAQAAITSAADAVRLDAVLADAGVPVDERADVLAGPTLTLETLADAEPGIAFGPAMLIVLLAIALLYGLLIFHGQWVAQGIVEEKQSRVIEVLLSAVRPTQLLGGKIAGLGLLGLAQIAVLATVALATMALVGAADIPDEVRGTLVLVVAWYVLGFALYATLFAASGAIAARTEDLQATTTPIIVLLIGAILVAQAAMADPNTTVANIAAYVPFTAPMVQPVRYAAGTSSWTEGVAAAAIAVAFIAAFVPLTSRLYQGGVLRTGSRISLREAWSADDRR